MEKSKSIDPEKVPQKILYTGAKMPGIGMGTFGSDKYSAIETANAVRGAAEIGYRFFDCASVYGNEDLIGEVFKDIMNSGIKREELFIASKVWNNMHDNVEEACKKTLKDLKLEYLDMYFVHWPFPNYHGPGVSVGSRDENAKPYIHENYMRTWREMEKLVESGLVRHIGTSNMTIPKLKLVIRDAKILPAANEMEIHPSFQQNELFKFIIANKMVPVGFCPIGSPARPDRDKAENDVVDIEDPIIVKIAKAHNTHPAVICVKWGAQRGHVPIPFSIHKNKYLSNFISSLEERLTEEERKEIEKGDKNWRLIKGQVFLWKGADSWEDLWDITGEITKSKI